MRMARWWVCAALTGCLDFGPPAPQLDPTDGATPDARVLDAAPDLAAADMRAIHPDATPDRALPDMAPDTALPDMTPPDMALPDMTLPDMALPDMAPSPEWTVPPFDGDMPLADWIWLRPPNLQAEVGDGQLIMRPDGGGWHDRRQAMLLYTRMTGDFVIEVTVQAVSRDDPNMPPRTPYNVAGLLVRSPLGGEENWVMVAIGEMDGQAGLESKFTTNGDSVRDEIAGPTSGRLRICRQGSQFTHLHWLDGAAGWETFAPGGAQTSRPDLLGEVQVGLVAGGWDEASIEARFRQVRLGRPARCDGPLP